MTSTKPRFGLNNLLWLNRRNLIASAEETTNPVEFLADLRPGLYWKPPWSSNPPPVAYVYCYPLDQAGLIPLLNWYFGRWTGGLPDSWELVGAGASVVANAGAKIHEYYARLTRTTDNCYLVQEVPSWGSLLGRYLTVGAWSWANVNYRARISIQAGTASAVSTYNTGVSAYEWLTATIEMPYDATGLEIRLENNGAAGVVGFDGVVLYLGQSAEATPHAQEVNYLALHDHNLADGAGQEVSLEYSEVPNTWAAPTVLLSAAPTANKTIWRDTQSPVSKAAWRLKFEGANGSNRPEVAVAAFGKYVELPNWISPGFDPWARTLASEVAETRHGVPLGRIVQRTPIPLSLEMPNPSVSFLGGDYLDIWSHLGDQGAEGQRGLPGFLAWNKGDFPDQAFYIYSPANAKGGSGGLVDATKGRMMRLDLLAVAE